MQAAWDRTAHALPATFETAVSSLSSLLQVTRLLVDALAGVWKWVYDVKLRCVC